MPECDLWWRNPGAASDEIWTLIPDASGPTVFHLAPFVSSEHHPRCAVRGRIERSAAPVPGTISLPSSKDHSVVAQSDYLETIRLALDSIANSDLQKVVLSRSDWWDETGDPESVFIRKCKEQPNALVYLLNIPEAGVWLGATPELLLSQQGRHFETVSLAGTRHAINGDWTAKEVREQALVTEFIASQLHLQQAENVVIDSAKDCAYGPFVHLQSRIQFDSDAEVDQWLDALHPTPAVGGEPRGSALDFIALHERKSRGYYAGYLGWSTGDQSTYYVNLRCMQWFADGARFYAGGGIVSGSNAAAEWEETVMKLQSIRQLSRG